MAQRASWPFHSPVRPVAKEKSWRRERTHTVKLPANGERVAREWLSNSPFSLRSLRAIVSDRFRLRYECGYIVAPVRVMQSTRVVDPIERVRNESVSFVWLQGCGWWFVFLHDMMHWFKWCKNGTSRRIRMMQHRLSAPFYPCLIDLWPFNRGKLERLKTVI